MVSEELRLYKELTVLVDIALKHRRELALIHEEIDKIEKELKEIKLKKN